MFCVCIHWFYELISSGQWQWRYMCKQINRCVLTLSQCHQKNLSLHYYIFLLLVFGVNHECPNVGFQCLGCCTRHTLQQQKCFFSQVTAELMRLIFIPMNGLLCISLHLLAVECIHFTFVASDIHPPPQMEDSSLRCVIMSGRRWCWGWSGGGGVFYNLEVKILNWRGRQKKNPVDQVSVPSELFSSRVSLIVFVADEDDSLSQHFTQCSFCFKSDLTCFGKHSWGPLPWNKPYAKAKICQH